MAFQLSFPGLVTASPPAEPAADTASLWDFPAISARDRQSHARALGRAGEALCDSLLLRYGLLPLVPLDHLPYDRLVVAGEAQARLQIKTCAVPTGGTWSFSLKKGYRGSPGGSRPYAPDDFDIAALVCLAANAVLFTTESGPWFRLSAHDVARAATEPRASLEQALGDIGISPTSPGPVTMAIAA